MNAYLGIQSTLALQGHRLVQGTHLLTAKPPCQPFLHKLIRALPLSWNPPVKICGKRLRPEPLHGIHWASKTPFGRPAIKRADIHDCRVVVDQGDARDAGPINGDGSHTSGIPRCDHGIACGESRPDGRRKGVLARKRPWLARAPRGGGPRAGGMRPDHREGPCRSGSVGPGALPPRVARRRGCASVAKGRTVSRRQRVEGPHEFGSVLGIPAYRAPLACQGREVVAMALGLLFSNCVNGAVAAARRCPNWSPLKTHVWKNTRNPRLGSG